MQEGSMRSSRTPFGSLAAISALLAVFVYGPCVMGQSIVKGFAVERLNAATPGSSYVVMDDLQLEGKLGGAVSFTGGYAHNPFGVTRGNGSERLHVVEHQAAAALALAVLYDRFRFSLDFTSPVYVKGKSGTIGARRYLEPDLDIGKYPDVVSDVRIGVDSRLFGSVNGPLRLGLSTQLFVPSGKRRLYITDSTFRAILRAPFAGNVGRLAYAGYVGVHLRPLHEDRDTFGPKGSELLYGLAAGPQFAIRNRGDYMVGFGPEVFGATAFDSFAGARTTGLEALLSGRLERRQEDGALLRFKLGFGEGLKREFGTPDYRCVVAIELVSRTTR
jgi:hypothetical protein